MDKGDLTDEALMIRAAKGDRRAFEGIYDRYAGRLYNYFLKMLHQDEELAKDQTQELFMKLAEKGHQYDGKRAFKTYVFSIANNMCKNIYRSEEVKKRANTELKIESETTESQKMENIDRKAFKTALTEELEKFDSERRSIFILRYKHQLSIKEIAETTGVAEGTVKSKLFYTLKKLSTQLVSFNPK
ncbi:MAG: RNA polymerase sigma-70 factor (ECF subfamily) [Cryomorphaceae bacterium]|jgi:RNA polymerase sigma-70 factor (ECF subfamily)